MTLLCLTAQAVADRGGLWDEGFGKMAAKCQSSSSPYTISTSEFSDEEDTVDCEIIEKDSEQESYDTESGPEERKQEDSKRPRKKNKTVEKGRKSS